MAQDQQQNSSSEDEENSSQRKVTGGRNANPAYELFVIGELMDSPQYGYRLQRIGNNALGPLHQLTWGTLYPLLRRLEKHGLITSEPEPEELRRQEQSGQPRKVYRITEAGKAHFFELMLQPGEYNRDYRDLFAVKLIKFKYLTTAQQLAILQQFRNYLTKQLAFYEGSHQRVTNNRGITDDERPFILQQAEYHLCTLKTELAWVNKIIEQTSNRI